MADFNFLIDPPAHEPELEPLVPSFVGPNLKSATKMTPRKFAASVLEVFEKLGGTSWLLTQAIADPKAFLDLLKKLIPKSVQLDDLTGWKINLIDQFGNSVEIQQAGALPESATNAERLKSGQLQIATGGSPSPLDPISSTGQGDSPAINITDIFK